MAATEKFNAAPDDITPLGQKFFFDGQIEKLKSIKFPKTGGENDRRSFQLQWVYKFKWIEYSISRDAVFCNTCRQFGLGKQSKEPTFTLTGFNKWRVANSEGKGLLKHNASIGHKEAEMSQMEKLKRIESNQSVSELLSTSVLQKRRYYCKSIIEVIEYLAGNRLALRGDWNDEEKEEGGLFNSLFELVLKKDPELIACQKYMPPNVTYKSPQIQNELIGIMAQVLRASIVDEIIKADADVFTILFDGTKDKNGNECVSLAARFVRSGKPMEVLLFFETTVDLDAHAFTTLLIESLDMYGLDANKIISQCYDGAAVMNGYKSGVAKRLQEDLGKIIPYVHCFNHRLHLIIVHTVTEISLVKQFFEQLQLIYKTFKKHKIRKLYEGKAVKRLLDTRWNGHMQATKAVFQNYSEIVATLQLVKNDRSLQMDGDDIATCIGILSVITQKKFVFLMVFMDEFLSAMAPADTLFQKQEISYHRAVPMIEALKSTIAGYRNSETFDKIMKKLKSSSPHHQLRFEQNAEIERNQLYWKVLLSKEALASDRMKMLKLIRVSTR